VRSLFAKVLLWFLGTSAITIGVVTLLAFISFNSDRQGAQTPFPILVRAYMREARYAYENGGKPALAEALRRFHSVINAEMSLADANGRDLLTGQDRSRVIQENDRRRFPFPFPFPRPTFARQTQDGKYWFIVSPQKQSAVLWFLQPEHLAVYGVVVLLCWLLAYSLTSPISKLQLAVEKFGRGDFSARAESKRRDEIGGLARTFNQMADRIQTLVTAERRLLMDISHELRSPLARLAVAVELARSGHDHDASLDRIQKEADRLNAMVGELLEITRAEGDPAQRKHEHVRLDELVEEIVEDCRLEAKANGADIQLEPPAGCYVDGDSELLRRAIENVVRNAVRYTASGQRVEVLLGFAGDHARVTVRDYGPGVPEASLPMLFEPFYRVDSDRKRNSGGVGLGLSIARRSVVIHSGTIRAENAGPGLRVEISLPARPYNPEPQAQNAPNSQVSAS
jgi:two-component system sensor histidine kinase CpxA